MSNKKRNTGNTGNARADASLPSYVRVDPGVLPSGADVFAAIAGHKSLMTYLSTHSQILRPSCFGTSQEWHSRERCARAVLQRIAESGMTLQVPAGMCSELEQNVAGLDESVMAWPLEKSALPVPLGYCRFAAPIRLPTQNGGVNELAAITWAPTYFKDPDVPADLATADIRLQITGLVKTWAESEGAPMIVVDWKIGNSYTDNLEWLTPLSGSDQDIDETLEDSLLRVFAGMFQTAQSQAWKMSRVITTDKVWVDDVWGDLKSVLTATVSSRAQDWRTQPFLRHMMKQFREVAVFVPATAIGDIDAIAS